MALKVFFFSITAFLVSFFHPAAVNHQTIVPPLPTTIPTVISNPSNLVPPVADFKARITKKFFGTYVTPQNSPVKPERFTGFHTGVDVEYGDVSGIVPVFAIADGTVLRSGWVSGYGGMLAIRHVINGRPYVAIYGHLNPSGLVPSGTIVTKGQQIGILGVASSHETDGERRHLHFALHIGSALNVLGYVQHKSELGSWVDPLTFYP